MPRHKPHQTPSEAPVGPAGGQGLRGVRLLVLGRATAWSETVRPFEQAGAEVVCLPGPAECIARAGEGRVDVLLVGGDDPMGPGVIRAVHKVDPTLSCVVRARNKTADEVLTAVRTGAIDVIVGNGREDSERILAAASRAAGARRERRKTESRRRRLLAVCRALRDSRAELLRQMGEMCGTLAGTYRDMTSQLANVAMSSDFNALVRQELDVEGLLRTTLEYLLKRTGPTNAAIFLPGSSGEYSLGAYVNYDCPRDTVETLLDRLADVAAPAFEDRTDIVQLRSNEALTRTLGEAARWMEGSHALALSCRHEGECLAVCVLFRDRRHPFSDTVVEQVRLIADLFTSQLARVIRTHHRHLSDDRWPGKAGSDDIDLAA